MLIRKILSLIIVLFCFINLDYSQVLKNTTLNLNIGGSIYDVTYIPNIKKYVIVGEFTSINSLPRTNIAILNEDFTLNGGTINVSGGEIYAVEALSNLSTNYIMIGGRFTTVGTNSINGLARLTISNGTFPNDPVNISLVLWNPMVNEGVPGIMDLELNIASNSVVAVGFFTTCQRNSGADSTRNHIAQFSMFTGELSGTAFDSNNGITGGNFSQTLGTYNYPLKIRLVSDGILVCGEKLEINYLTGASNQHYVLKYNFAGKLRTNVTIPAYNFNSTTWLGAGSRDFFDMTVLDNSRVLINTRDPLGNAGSITLNHQTGVNTRNYFQDNTSLNFLYRESEIWNNNLYAFRNQAPNRLYVGDIRDSLSTKYYYTKNHIPLGIGASSPETNTRQAFHIVNNFLFISNTSLVSVNGTPRTRLAIMCLEPKNPSALNNNYDIFNSYELDSVVCNGNIKQFTLPPNSNDFAVGYAWSYTGTGLEYGFSTLEDVQPTVFFPFSDTIYKTKISGAAHQIWVKVGSNFTPGTLSVQPYCDCNPTDTLLAKASTVQLIQAPLPNLSIPTATTLNCIQESVTLTPSSSTSNVSFTWYNVLNDSVSGLSQTVNTDAIQEPDTSKTLYIEVQETTGNQCKVRDTVIVYKDVREPGLIKDTTMFGMWNCYTDSMLVGVVDTNSFSATLTLNSLFIQNSDTIFSQSGYVQSPDLIVFIANYLETGCSDTLSSPINTDLDPPAQSNIFATVDGVQSDFLGLDILNCTNDSSLLVLSNTANYDTYWIFNNDTIQDSLILSINHPLFVGFPDSIASTQNHSFYYYAFDPSNGCSNVFLTAISFEVKNPVFATDFVGDSTLNCSETELTLIYPPTLSLLNQGWLVSGINSSNDSLTVTNAGEQVFEIVGLNGCKNYDTVTVVQTNELSFAPLEDRFVCPDIPFTITAQTLGNETYSYLWNGLTSGATFTGTGGIDTLLVVSTTNGTGCSGQDTIRVQITSPINATFYGYSECGDNISIQVTDVSGGASATLNDYEFRFNDELTYTPFSGILPNYSVDSFALYPLWIKDSLGCEYEFQTEISGQILKPTSEFLVSTYNQSLDTLYIANINQYTGFDFVTWSSPNLQIEWVAVYDSSALFTYQDTGWVEIVMTGYILDSTTNIGQIDTCAYPLSKWIYFGLNAVIWDDTANIGINSASLSPSFTNNGNASINLNITFGSAQEYQVFTTTTLGAKINDLSFTSSVQSAETVTHQLNLPSLAVGVYYVNILSRYGGIQLTLTIQ